MIENGINSNKKLNFSNKILSSSIYQAVVGHHETQNNDIQHNYIWHKTLSIIDPQHNDVSQHNCTQYNLLKSIDNSTTLITMTLSITIINKMTLSIMTLSITITIIMTLSIMSFGKMTLSIKLKLQDSA